MNTCMFPLSLSLSLGIYICGYALHFLGYILIAHCVLNKFGISRKFGISFNSIYFTAKWWVKFKMFNTSLKMPILAILQHFHWSCWCCISLLLWHEIPDTFASHKCPKDWSPMISSLVWHSHWSWLCYKPRNRIGIFSSGGGCLMSFLG